jgi:hypothetical protein
VQRRTDRGFDVPAQVLPLLDDRLQPLLHLGDLGGRAFARQIDHQQNDQPVHIGPGAGIQALPLDPRHRRIVAERLEDRRAAFGESLLPGQTIHGLAPARVLVHSQDRRR